MTHRERAPRDWVNVQSNLARALDGLGQRESGTARLEEGVVAFPEALKERTPERVPLVWALMQNGLGAALCATLTTPRRLLDR